MVNPRQLREILARTRELGYSITLEETAANVCGIGSAILDQFQRPLAAIVIGAPMARGAAMAVKYAEAVCAAALRISKVLGYAP